MIQYDKTFDRGTFEDVSGQKCFIERVDSNTCLVWFDTYPGLRLNSAQAGELAQALQSFSDRGVFTE